MQTEFEFFLPVGYIDGQGIIQQKGVMRLASAADELTAVKKANEKGNAAAVYVFLLAKVIKNIGTCEEIKPEIIEDLFARDYNYLKDFYQKINDYERNNLKFCPHCGKELE